jgi:hypothetical protein
VVGREGAVRVDALWMPVSCVHTSEEYAERVSTGFSAKLRY